MSLNREQMQVTGSELRANAELTGLAARQIADDLDWAVDDLEATLAMDDGRDPADVWLLRDYLFQAVTDAGRTPVPFSVLTEAGRRSAERWFRLHAAPRHHFA